MGGVAVTPCDPADATACVLSILGGAGKKVAGDAFASIAESFAKAAGSVTRWLWATMGEATAVRFGGPGWQRDLGITVSIALVVGVGLFLVQVTTSALRLDFAGLGRAVRGMFIAWGAGGAAITVTEALLAAADSVSKGVMQVGAGTSSWQGFGERIVAPTALQNLSQAGLSAALVLLAALAMIAASVVVWAALMVRKLLLIVAAVFAPVAFCGAQSDITRSWVRRWIEVTVALIASKVVLVVIFVVGLGVLDTGVGAAGVHGGVGQVAQSGTQMVTGTLILCMAGFAPWLAIKLVHFAGDSFHTVHAHAQAAGQGARSVAAMPQKFRPVLLRGGASGVGAQAGTSSPDADTGQVKPAGPAASPRPGHDDGPQQPDSDSDGGGDDSGPQQPPGPRPAGPRGPATPPPPGPATADGTPGDTPGDAASGMAGQATRHTTRPPAGTGRPDGPGGTTQQQGDRR